MIKRIPLIAITAILVASCGLQLPENMENRLIIPNRFQPGQENKCPQGGIKFTTGVDENLDGVLDNEEIDKIQFICSGEPIPTDLLSAVVEESE